MGHRRKLRWIVACLVAMAAVSGLLAILVSPPSEPVYRGKGLTIWLRELPMNAGPNDPRMQAILAMGTNVLPILNRIISQRELPLSGMFKVWLHHLPLYRRSAEMDLRWRAVCAFKILGPRATPSVPALSAILEANKNPGYAASALAAIGPSGVSSLAHALSHSDAKVRFSAASALGGMQHEAQPALPQLRSRLTDPVYFVREAATNALRRIAPGP